MHYFKWSIDKKEYIFQVFNLEKVIAYYKYFYLQKKEYSNNENLSKPVVAIFFLTLIMVNSCIKQIESPSYSIWQYFTVSFSSET